MDKSTYEDSIFERARARATVTESDFRQVKHHQWMRRRRKHYPSYFEVPLKEMPWRNYIHFEEKSATVLLTKPITYHMDSTTELHPLVEGHLMDARVQGE